MPAQGLATPFISRGLWGAALAALLLHILCLTAWWVYPLVFSAAQVRPPPARPPLTPPHTSSSMVVAVQILRPKLPAAPQTSSLKSNLEASAPHKSNPAPSIRTGNAAVLGVTPPPHPQHPIDSLNPTSHTSSATSATPPLTSSDLTGMATPGPTAMPSTPTAAVTQTDAAPSSHQSPLPALAASSTQVSPFNLPPAVHAATASAQMQSAPLRPLKSHHPKPIYPKSSQSKGESGSVHVRVWVRPSGRVGRVDLVRSSGFAELDRAALLTVQDDWRYHWPKSMSSSTPIGVEEIIKFQLDD